LGFGSPNCSATQKNQKRDQKDGNFKNEKGEQKNWRPKETLKETLKKNILKGKEKHRLLQKIKQFPPENFAFRRRRRMSLFSLAQRSRYP